MFYKDTIKITCCCSWSLVIGCCLLSCCYIINVFLINNLIYKLRLLLPIIIASWEADEVLLPAACRPIYLKNRLLERKFKMFLVFQGHTNRAFFFMIGIPNINCPRAVSIPLPRKNGKGKNSKNYFFHHRGSSGHA